MMHMSNFIRLLSWRKFTMEGRMISDIGYGFIIGGFSVLAVTILICVIREMRGE